MMEDLHRVIAERCLLKYKQISKNKGSDSEWSPLAAVALVQNSCSGSNIEVVSMGTGSKCIGPKRMDKDGKLCNNLTHLQLVMIL